MFHLRPAAPGPRLARVSTRRPAGLVRGPTARPCPLLRPPAATAPPAAEDALASLEDEGLCEPYITPDGDMVEVMCGDYGFRSGSGRLYDGGDGEVPESAFALATANFGKELRALREATRFGPPAGAPTGSPPSTALGRAASSAAGRVVSAFARLDEKLEGAGVLPRLARPGEPGGPPASPGPSAGASAVRTALARLTLNDDAVWEREKARARAPGATRHSAPVRAFYLALCWVLDTMYAGRPIQRFWFLETVARMPYFAYISMLHLYESLGWWRGGAELRRVHFAEEWNELHHLQIMEALGGDASWGDRALAAHASLFYYWFCVGAYLFSPATAYAFSELVEGHAVDTYTQFAQENEAVLRSLAPPRVALEYYRSADPYLFDALDTAPPEEGGGAAPAPLPRRRPACDTLFDVFVNVRDDEVEHEGTMAACRRADIGPALAARKAAVAALAASGEGQATLPAPTATPAPTARGGGVEEGRAAANPEAAAPPLGRR